MTTPRNQRGDTIVEVLLAMAVLGMVLGTSFGIVNRSLATGRDAQERSEASKLTESQIEKLKTASSDPDNGFFNIAENSIYCITDTLDVEEFDSGGIIQDDVDLSTYTDPCKSGPDGRYRLSIIRSGNVFTVRSRWNSIRGDQLNEAKMTYRTYSYSSREYPVVSTDQSVTVSGLNATVTGRVTDQGKTAVTSKGFIYNTVAGQHPSAGTKVPKGSGIGEFTTVLTGLSQDTTYYVRSFATNQSGTSYGSETRFAVVAPTAPVITTVTVSDIQHTGGRINSGVSSDGGSPVTEKGIVISRNANPTIGASGARKIINTVSATGTGSISVLVGGLLPSTRYYVHSYAINSVGTSYDGGTVSFETTAIPGGVPIASAGEYNGHTYFVSTQAVRWSVARDVANASGGHLVTISNAAENAYVSALSGGGLIWIGLNDIATEGNWVWETGEPRPYTNWATGEPNNYSVFYSYGEDAAVMNWGGSGTGRWNDWYDNPESTAVFVIEYDN
jgi:type II secretory pathway pseudopilin PulG